MSDAQVKRPARGGHPEPAAEQKTRRDDSRHAFRGTDNPRALRVLAALLVRPRPREEIDRLAGASNGPALIADLRGMGLELPCRRAPVVDRDGELVQRGVYSRTDRDRRRIAAWQRRRAMERASK